MASLVLGVATKWWEGADECMATWDRTCYALRPRKIVEGRTILGAYQEIYETTGNDVIGYLHDDLQILEQDWDKRTMDEFNDSRVGIVGWGGATGHGSKDLYTSPYHLPNLGRRNFMSNMRTAEAHGQRFSGTCEVAVIDGFSLFVRRIILDRIGGWKALAPATYYLYTEALCCEARRQGFKIKLVGVACDHLGGKTSTTANITDDFQAAHKWLYDNYRDVLPYEAK